MKNKLPTITITLIAIATALLYVFLEPKKGN